MIDFVVHDIGKGWSQIIMRWTAMPLHLSRFSVYRCNDRYAFKFVSLFRFIGLSERETRVIVVEKSSYSSE